MRNCIERMAQHVGAGAAVANALECVQGPPCFYLLRGSWRNVVLTIATVVRPLTRDEAAKIEKAYYAKRP